MTGWDGHGVGTAYEFAPGRHQSEIDTTTNKPGAAEEPNDPAIFIAVESKSLVSGNNLHRNVILRDEAERAVQVRYNIVVVRYAPCG